MNAVGLTLLLLAGFANGGTIKLFTGEVMTGEIELGEVPAVRTEAGPTVKVDPANIQYASWRETRDGYVPGVVLRTGARFKSNAIKDALAAEIAWIVYRPVTSQEAKAAPNGKTGALLPGGDFFEGAVRSADQNTAKIVSPIFGPRMFDARRGEILAAVLAPVNPSASAYQVQTTDGEMLLADQITYSSTAVTLVSAGKTQTVAVSDLAEIRAGPGRSIPLAATRIARADVARGIPQTKGITINALPDGGALQVGSDQFEHGLASLSGCAAVWEIPAHFTELVARFGVAPATSANIRLSFIVVADGRSLFRSQPMTVADAPQTLRVSLGNARTITLRVETQFPSGGIGTGVWIEPALLRR